MWEWLLTPVHAEQTHLISSGVSWHGRIMVFAWGFLSPLAILVARFAKILPWQNWPQELDNRTWWNSHWVAQTAAIILTLFGLIMILLDANKTGGYLLHRLLGYSLIACGAFQGLSGLLRGTKGGPTSPAKDGSWHGDHYDMTDWRLKFELLHKTVGYTTLALAFLAVPNGMWIANAPNWMFVTLFSWWTLLVILFVVLQRCGFAVETYQAIWGPDSNHPGNNKPPIGWGVVRPSEKYHSSAGE